MIEVVLFNMHGKVASAEAETPEEAVYAARRLWDEQRQHCGSSRQMSAGFYVDGKLVRWVARRSELEAVMA